MRVMESLCLNQKPDHRLPPIFGDAEARLRSSMHDLALVSCARAVN